MASESAALGARPIDTEMELMALSFDATYYYQNRPDVLKAFLDSGAASAYEFALAHYNNFGWKEGANPNAVFNTKEYLAKYEDVAKAGVNPFTHYTTHGQAEGRAPNGTFPALAEFDWQTYLNSNPDLGIEGITTKEAAYDHYITFGYAENRPGAPDNSEFKLQKALDALTDAKNAVADFIDDARSNELLIKNQGVDENTVADDVRDAIQDELDAASSDLETATNLSDFSTRSEALQKEAIAEKTAALTSDINDLNKKIAKIDGLAAAIKAFHAAEEAKEGADTALTSANTDSKAALAAFNVRTGATYILANEDGDPIDWTAESILDVVEVADGGAPVIVYNDADKRFELATGVTETAKPGVSALLDALNANLAAKTKAVAATDALSDAAADLAEFDAELAGTDLASFANAEAVADQVVTLANALDTFNEAVARFENAKSLAESLGALDDAIADATDALEALGYNTPVTINTDLAGSDEGDIFIYEDQDTDFSFQIEDFGASGDDMIVFGKEFKLVKLDEGADITKGKFGNVAELEIFYQETAAGTMLYIEDDSYDASAAGFAGNKIELVGVDASSITFENGILRVVTDVA